MSAAEAVIGHNNPPTPFDDAKAKVDDLMTEARNWLDGTAVSTEAEAEAVSKLMDMARKVKKEADEARKVEAKPFDEGKAEVQGRYKPLLESADRAADACKAALQPWLVKLDAEKRAREEAARLEADEKARVAAEAMRAAAPADLAAREAAEALLGDAVQAEAAAGRAAKDKAHATGGARATTLRSYFHPELVNPREALAHYCTHQPEAVKAFLLELAATDVREGKRLIPGFEIIEEKKVV